MAIDAFNLQRTKEAIVSFIRARGPSLPVHIAQNVKTSPLFASAFLSELYNEQKLKMSHMKVGSTSLYYIPGQEPMLENFISHLNNKEKEAFLLLKEKKVLDDLELQPAIRVAIRQLRDFAIPMQQTLNGQTKTFWKFAFDKTQQEIDKQIQMAKIPDSVSQAIPSSILQATIPIQTIQPPAQIHEKEKETKPKIRKEIKRKQTIQPSFSLTEPIIQKAEETPFSRTIKQQLKNKDIEIFAIELEKKKEFSAIVRIKTLFGYQDYYCIAKDKKTINESDIPIALQKAQEKRMPILYLIQGKPNKKAEALLHQWGNLIKIMKIG